MGSLPDVSVVVPTRDRAASVVRTLRSVAAQTTSVEMIVVDDGSTDDTPGVLSRWSAGELTVIRHPSSQGVSAARNSGLAAAHAPWVAFCDDDDLWAPDKLAAQMTALEPYASADWCAVGAVWVDNCGRTLRGDLPPETGDVANALLRENQIPGGASGVLARTSAVRDLGGFDPALQTLADWDLWIRLALRGIVAAVPRPLVAYQVHSTNMSFDVGHRRRDLAVLQEKHATTMAERGVTIDLARQRRYDAMMGLRAGRRLGPALHQAEEAMRRRRPKLLRRAAMTLIAPAAVQRRHDDRKVTQLPIGWADEVAAWLPIAWAI